MLKTISRRSSGLIIRNRSEFPSGAAIPLVEGQRKSNEPGEYIYLRSLPQ